jgi:type VI secretion system protein ImpA
MEDSVVGKDFRQYDDLDSPYLQLKDWRATARRLEREAASSEDLSETPLSAAIREWEDIASLADAVLQKQAKDLEIASWYVEALVRTGGFEGLAQGFELLSRLVEDFWQAGLYPQEDEDGVDTRLAPLAGLIGRGVSSSLVQPIKLVPLSDRTDQTTVALWNIELAFTPARGESSEASDRKGAEVAQVLQTVKSSSPDFLRWTRKGIDRALSNLNRLMTAVDAETHAGGFASQVSTPLLEIAKILDDHVGHLFVAEAAPSPEPDQDGGKVENELPVVEGGFTPTRTFNREEALQALERAADYFERSEPQALIAGSIRDVVRRARLPMMELLVELLPDDNLRGDFLLRAGIKDPNR